MATSEANKPMKISSPPGSTMPLLAGALGKVFLAQSENGGRAGIIREHGLPQFTKATIIDEQAYLKEASEVCQRGYALDLGEYLSGVNAVAVGLGSYSGLQLAVWVVGFAESLQPENLDAVIESTMATAAILRKVLKTN
jgi:DNA-binding IclR family transcriptional regulator